MDDAANAVADAALLVQVPEDYDDGSAAQSQRMVRKPLGRECVQELLRVGRGIVVLRIGDGVVAGGHKLGGRIQTLEDRRVENVDMLVPGREDGASAEPVVRGCCVGPNEARVRVLLGCGVEPVYEGLSSPLC